MIKIFTLRKQHKEVKVKRSVKQTVCLKKVKEE